MLSRLAVAVPALNIRRIMLISTNMALTSRRSARSVLQTITKSMLISGESSTPITDTRPKAIAGCCRFRVWQFFDAMKGFAANRDAEQFLCAAGLLSHYVGDACQPLHGSIYAEGDPETKEGAGVHACYETSMIESKQGLLVPGIKAAITQHGPALPQIRTGKDAALATIQLMDRSAITIPPKKIVAAFVKAGGKDIAAVRDDLWKKFGAGTIAVMRDGARVLARIRKERGPKAMAIRSRKIS